MWQFIVGCILVVAGLFHIWASKPSVRIGQQIGTQIELHADVSDLIKWTNKNSDAILGLQKTVSTLQDRELERLKK